MMKAQFIMLCPELPWTASHFRQLMVDPITLPQDVTVADPKPYPMRQPLMPPVLIPEHFYGKRCKQHFFGYL